MVSEESRNFPPKTLYKYCSPDRIDVLQSKRIRFTQGVDLNDVFEMLPVGLASDPDSWAAAVHSVAHNTPGWVPVRETAEEIESRCRDVLKDVLVLCLSADWNIIPMWAYYAGDNKGFVVGFDAESEFFTDLKKVKYEKARPKCNGPQDFGAAIYTKYKGWQHENEWRAMRVLGLHKPDSTVELNGAPFPIHLFSFPPRMSPK
jgi:hypothetical protein